jgi:hypothetical protein
MKTIDIMKLDDEKCFIHYTNISNLKFIEKEGLIPKIGDNSLFLEKTPKVFL